MEKNNHAQESYHGAGNSQLIQADGEEFDSESIILRRADPDDCDAIINLVEIGEDDIYNRVYCYPKILRLIETAYLAITVIDRDGNICAFAAFEDFPQVSNAFARLASSRFRSASWHCEPAFQISNARFVF